MENIITIDKKGKCKRLNIDDFKFNYNDKLEKSDFEHLLIYDFDEQYKLVIDSFNDQIELVEKELSAYFFKEDIIIKEKDLKKLKYYQSVFLSPYTKNGKNRLFKIYNEELKDNKSNDYYFSICPTYNCNMKCIYCFQQNDFNLNKDIISDENLKKIFKFIEMEAKKIRENNKSAKVAIELFGGEPIQKNNRKIIEDIFEFIRKNKFYIGITTNGVELKEFYDLLITYRKYICVVSTTIDGDEYYHNSRRISKRKENSFINILNNIEFLLDLGVKTKLFMTIDYKNLNQIEKIIEIIKRKKWDWNKNFEFRISRVDDRLYETNYELIISETELLKYILDLSKKIEFPKNLKIAFLNTIVNLAKRFDVAFNQTGEGKQKFHYCWATSKLGNNLYVDLELKTFRCTCTVGKKELTTGNLIDGINDSFLQMNNSLDIEECFRCKIGGFCGGGCALSHKVDKERQCKEEKENFDKFIKEIIIPKIKNEMNGF